MGRRTANQLALPIGNFEPPEDLLREAHQRSRLQQSFEEVMQLQHFRIALKHLAMIMASKRRSKQ